MGHAKTTNCSVCGEFGPTRKVQGIEEYLCLVKCGNPKLASELIVNREQAEKAYEIYRRHSRSRVPFPEYGQLYWQFISPEVAISDVARQYQMSRERMGQIYRRFFSAHLPNMSDGFARRTLCSQQRAEAKPVMTTEDFQLAFRTSERFRPLVRYFRGKSPVVGLEPLLIPTNRIQGQPYRISQDFLYMNGVLCKFSHVQSAPDFGHCQRYWHVSTNNLCGAEKLVFLVGDGTSHRYRLFVFLRKIFAGQNKVYVRFSNRKSNSGRKTRTDILSCEDRLDLL